jgi:SAM-dependent methyltransferase
MCRDALALFRCPDCRASLASDAQGLCCQGCGARYPVVDTIPRLVGRGSTLADSEIATQDYVSDRYEQLRYRLPWSRRYHEHALGALLDLSPPRGRVLDAGCGNGLLLEHLARRRAPVDRYVGIDVSSGMLAHARERRERLRRAGEAAPTSQLAQADVLRLPFAADTFDLVVARGLLHHLSDPAAGLRELARVLRPAGSVLLLDPNRTALTELPRRLVRGGRHFDAGHRSFRLDDLRSFIVPPLSLRRLVLCGFVAYPLLGFPDVVDFGRVLPLGAMAPVLIGIDDLLGRLPVVRRLAWGVMVAADKR